MIKTDLEGITTQKLSTILSLTEKEIQDLLQEIGATSLNRFTMFHILMRGSSMICKLFYKQIIVGELDFYTLEDIYFIYEICPIKIKKGSEDYGKELIPREELMEFFKHVEMENFSFVYEKGMV